MSLKVDDLNTFKLHRNNVSESLCTEIIGREKDIEELCLQIRDNNYVAIVGAAGIGKSRLAIASIEKFLKVNCDFKVLCTKNFGDYIQALDDVLLDEEKYVIFVDDANNYSKLIEMLEYLKYRNIGNIKVILTIRDYLKQCLDKKEEIIFYEVTPLDGKTIREAIIKNSSIKNDAWLDQIVRISNGNIRVAFIAASNALKDPKGFVTLFNQNQVLNRFYKEEIAKIYESEELIITSAIVAFFKNIYLEQLFYIAPILNNVGMSKQSFIRNVNILISKEIVDDYNGVVRISDQCFSDYLINYVIVEKRYLSIKSLIMIGFRYYKKHIIESLGTILNVYYSKDFIVYLKRELLVICDSLNDNITLKHDLETTFVNIIPEYVVADYKEGVDKYSDKKDITWLLSVFSNLSLSEYSKIAIEGIFKLFDKTKTKIDEINKAIVSTFRITNEIVNNGFEYILLFLETLNDKKFYNDTMFDLVSGYLKFNFDYTEWFSIKELRQYSFNIADSNKNILKLRKLAWDYIFNFSNTKVLDVIFDFAEYYLIDNCVEIIKNDLEYINVYLKNHLEESVIKTILYVKFYDDAVKNHFENLLVYDNKYFDFFDILFERRTLVEDYEGFKKRYKDCVRDFIRNNNVYSIIDDTKHITVKYFKSELQRFVYDLLDSIQTYDSKIFDVLDSEDISPYIVIEKVALIANLDEIYNKVITIMDSKVRDAYLYSFYRYISLNKMEFYRGFTEWIKSKDDLGINCTYSRNIIDLRYIAIKNNIEYVELIRMAYKKRKYNLFIAKCYLSPLLLNPESFMELLQLNQDFAIEVYEFLIDNNERDCQFECLKKITETKKNYAKTIARKFIDEKIDFEEGLPFFLQGEQCSLFFNELMIICLSEYQYLPSFQICHLLFNSIKYENVQRWIDHYIESNYKNDLAMNMLFSLLASTEYQFKRKYLIQYYKKGKSIEVIRSIFLNKVQSCCDVRAYFNSEIKELESLKKDFMEWGNLDVLNFINIMIDDFKNNIINNEINSIVDYDRDAFKELRDMDYKTEISLKDAFDLYVNDVGFRKMIDSGYASYINGSYVTSKEEPVRFVDVLKEKKTISVKVKADEDYEEYLSSMKSIIKKFNYKDKATLNECLISLIKERGWKTQDFKDNTYLSKDMYSKIMNNKKEKIEKKTLVQILIGFQLSKYERDELLNMNETPLSASNVDDVLYNFILASKMDIDTADELLRELGKAGF